MTSAGPSSTPGWVSEGRGWNEAYVLHACLAYNRGFKVTLFNHMMLTLHEARFARHMPRCLIRREGTRDDVPGHGLWLTKRAPA